MKTVKTVRKTNALKWFIFLFIVCMACTAFATNTVTSTETKKLAEWFFNEILGNALWDFIKLIPVIVIGFVIFVNFIVSPFFQSLHVYLFLYGSWYGMPKFWGEKKKNFGKIVDYKDTKTYRKFKCENRETVIGEINAGNGVFLVMGPTGVGKRRLTFAESNAKYIIKLERDDWYDAKNTNYPIKEILKERTELLVKRLLIKRSVLVVLMWDRDKEAQIGTVSVPSQNGMKEIIKYLAQIRSDKKFNYVSFVLAIPAYYQDFGNFTKGDYGEGNNEPKALSVYRLTSKECERLFFAELDACGYKQDIISPLEEAASKLNVELGKKIWIDSFGMPEYVIRIAKEPKYNSIEAWTKLKDWWNEVYAGDDKDQWLTYLYILALNYLMGKRIVNAYDFAKKLCGDRNIDKIAALESALKKIFVNQRSFSVRFDFRMVDVELLFEEPYVIERFVSSLGGVAPLLISSKSKNGRATENIFTFTGEIPKMIEKVFDLQNSYECERIAEAYLETSERRSNLVERLENQYLLLKKIEEVFGEDSLLVGAYKSKLENNALQKNALDLISRLGAMPNDTTKTILKGISSVLLAYNNNADYAKLIFELLPVYIITDLIPHCWSIEYQVLIDEINNSDTDSIVKFRCAVIICISYYLMAHNDEFLNVEEIKTLREIIEPTFKNIQNYFDDKNECWIFFKQMLPIIKSFGKETEIPKLDNEEMPTYVSLAWLYVLSCLAGYPKKATSCLDKKTMTALNEISDKIDLKGTAGRLLTFCKAYIPYSNVYDMNSDKGVACIKQGINYFEQTIQQWTDCPQIAAKCFKTFCIDLEKLYKNKKGAQSVYELDELWKLLKKWYGEFLDSNYSHTLASFTSLIRCISDQDKDNYELNKILPQLILRIQTIWKPIVSGEKTMEEWTMIKDYFQIFSDISNIETIPASDRKQILDVIVPDDSVLKSDLSYNDSAWSVYNCNSELVPPHYKLFWASLLLVGRTLDPWPDLNDASETIRVAKELIQEARNNSERIVDEELVQLLYEANGIPIDN